MLDVERAWQPRIAWDAPAGRVLLALLDVLPQDQAISISVFGSAPLQLGVDASFLSADVDVFSAFDLSDVINRVGLGKGQSEIYIEQSPEFIFSASPSWRERAFVFQKGKITLVFPHPIDILVSKLGRLEPKDLNAFRLVQERTGHPTEDELRFALQRHVDLYRPNFDEENSGDPLANTQIVWRELFGHTINVRAEIIAPALALRRRASGGDIPRLRDELPT